MIEWNKVTWYSKLSAALFFLLVFPGLYFFVGGQYQVTETFLSQIKGGSFGGQSLSARDVRIGGINPSDISFAPVPATRPLEEKVTTDLSLKSNTGEVLHFNNGYIDLNTFFEYDPVGNYSMDLQLLGYANIGGAPTAVTLVSEKSGGTGYFPSIVLYQAEDNTPVVSQIIPIEGDRIVIESLLIRDDLVLLTFWSQGEGSLTIKKYRFSQGGLKEVER
jgi:hypothetical protein